MFWTIERPARFLAERAGISELAGTAEWLRSVKWGFTADMLVKVEADIVVGTETYDVELVYANLFPDTPAYVRPRSSTKRWSEHQYVGGVLCLEWGPDNWNQELTGSDLLRSAHKLLSMERGREEERRVIPSRHSLTFGQEVRASDERIVLTETARTYLESLATPAERTLVTQTIFHASTSVVFVSSASVIAGDAATRLGVPGGLEQGFLSWERKGRLFKSDAVDLGRTISNLEELSRSLVDAGFADFRLPDGKDVTGTAPEHLVLLVDRQAKARALRVVKAKELSFGEYTIVDHGDVQERRPPEHVDLAGKTAAIVGLGSLGSKVAVSLARCGIRKFLLVDDDVMTAANVVRNELNWAAVGANKVEGVKEALLLIAPEIDVRVRTTRISGQESAQSASTALDAVAGSDLIVDATANPHVFVQLAAIAKRRRKPLVWGEIFAGGIGALFGRSRPGKDPGPLAMRDGIHRYLGQFAPAPFRRATTYDVEGDSAPLIAFDADVTHFAGVMASFAMDAILERAAPVFPYSAYVLGFKKEWIFEAPFDTRPISVEIDEPAESTTVNEEEQKAVLEVLEAIAKQQADANANSAG